MMRSSVHGFLFGLLLCQPISASADKFAPNIILLSPVQGQTVAGSIALSAQADGTGGTTLQFMLDGKPFGTPITSGVCRVYLDTTTDTTLSNGIHTASAVLTAQDLTTSTAPPVTFTVANIPQITSVTLTPATIPLGGTSIAVAKDAAGQTMTTSGWVVEHPTLASITPLGVITATSVFTGSFVGRTEATTGIQTTSSIGVVVGAQLTVMNTALTQVLTTVTLGASTLPVGSTTQATALDAAGQPMVVTWMASSPTVAAISSMGVVTALVEGTTVISAQAGGVTKSVTLTVTSTTPTHTIDTVAASLAIHDQRLASFQSAVNVNFASLITEVQKPGSLDSPTMLGIRSIVQQELAALQPPAPSVVPTYNCTLTTGLFKFGSPDNRIRVTCALSPADAVSAGFVLPTGLFLITSGTTLQIRK